MRKQTTVSNDELFDVNAFNKHLQKQISYISKLQAQVSDAELVFSAVNQRSKETIQQLSTRPATALSITNATTTVQEQKPKTLPPLITPPLAPAKTIRKPSTTLKPEPFKNKKKTNAPPPEKKQEPPKQPMSEKEKLEQILKKARAIRNLESRPQSSSKPTTPTTMEAAKRPSVPTTQTPPAPELKPEPVPAPSIPVLRALLLEFQTARKQLAQQKRKFEISTEQFLAQLQMHQKLKGIPSPLMYKYAVLSGSLKFMTTLRGMLDEAIYVSPTNRTLKALTSRTISFFYDSYTLFDIASKLILSVDSSKQSIKTYEDKVLGLMFDDKKPENTQDDNESKIKKRIPLVSLTRWLPPSVQADIFQQLSPAKRERSKHVEDLLMTFGDAKELQQLYVLRHQIQNVLLQSHIDQKLSGSLLSLLEKAHTKIMETKTVDKSTVIIYLKLWRLLYNTLVSSTTLSFVPLVKE